MKDRVVVIDFEPGRGRQDDVGVARRFVHVRIDRDVEVEAIDRGVESDAIWGREHGISRDRHERANLTWSRRRHLIDHRRDGKLCLEFR